MKKQFKKSIFLCVLFYVNAPEILALDLFDAQVEVEMDLTSKDIFLYNHKNSRFLPNRRSFFYGNVESVELRHPYNPISYINNLADDMLDLVGKSFDSEQWVVNFDVKNTHWKCSVHFSNATNTADISYGNCSQSEL